MISHYRGKPLEEYTKQELIRIINEQCLAAECQRREHAKDLEMLKPLRRKKLFGIL